MLNARNVVATTIVIAVLSLAWMFYAMTRPPDSGGQGRDTYGTRAAGHRGAFEVLGALGIPVERVIGPPTAVVGRDATLVLWEPQLDLVAIEPAYLHDLARWVQNGGRVVVAPDARSPVDRSITTPRKGKGRSKTKPAPEKTVLGELGLKAVHIRTIDLNPDGKSSTGRQRPASEDLERLRELLTNAARPVPTRPLKVEATGSMSPLRGLVSTIEVPEEGLQVLDVGESQPDGTIAFRDPDDNNRILAASYRRGRGQIVVVGSPAIGENLLMARQDNSVLMVRLLSPSGRPVVFDEFYHGLTIRGNPLWLFAQPGYAATTLALLALIGAWTWREAVFLGPPLDPSPRSRRSIAEYVDAMARFLNRAKSSRAFLLREVRSGVLRSIRDELHLPPSRGHVEELAAVLARRDPRRARELVEAIAAVDEALSRDRELKESVAVSLFERMSRCL